MMNPQPQPQHQWLRKLLGEWTYEHEASCGPDKPPEKVSGIERVRPLGDLWVLCEGSGNMPGGGQAQMLMTLGFDPAKRRFVGTWVGSMMTHLWVYEGQVDDAQRVLTLNSEGPSFVSEGKTAKYQDIIEFLSDDHRTLTSRSLGEDGKWQQFMVAHYRRKKYTPRPRARARPWSGTMKSIDLIRWAMTMSDEGTAQLVKDLRDAPLTQPTSRGGNHPLWIMGHLATRAQRQDLEAARKVKSPA